jgi:hypothetical protein
MPQPEHWGDPLWAALERCITRLREHPRILHEKKPDAPEGLNAAEINRLAGRTVIAAESTREDGVEVQRWVVVHHPGPADPVRWRVWDKHAPPEPTNEPKLRRTVAHLLAWQQLAPRLASHGEARPPCKGLAEGGPQAGADCGGTVDGLSNRAWHAGGVEDAPSGKPAVATDLDALLSALDGLTAFVAEQDGDRPNSAFLELLAFDQEVSALCQVTGLALPPITYEGHYGNDFVGFCRIPVSRHAEGCRIWSDRGWHLAMRGLRRTAELARGRSRRQGSVPGEPTPPEPPRPPAGTGRCPAQSSDGRADAPGAGEVWGRDPLRAFEWLRDRVCDAVHIVCQIHRQALAAPPGGTLASTGRELHEPLLQAIAEAQAIWFDTPVRRYLDRPEGPVYLDQQETRTPPRVSGSCHHDLAMAVAVWLWGWIGESRPAEDYVAAMRLLTAAGDFVEQHLTSLTALVQCECQRGIARWKEDARPAGPTAPTVERPAGQTAPEQPEAEDKLQRAANRSEEEDAGASKVRKGGVPPEATLRDGREPRNSAPGGGREEVAEAEAPELGEREHEILRALLLLKAEGERRRVSRKKAARKADAGCNPSSYNKAIASLVGKGFVKSRTGPGGGIWLTPEGASFAKAIASSGA